MNKKILLLVLFQICLLASKSFAQPCNGTNDTCISNQQVNDSTNWHASHGALSFPNTNAPTPQPTSSKSISMWSYLNTGSGAFTCYKFVKTRTYRVCYWVRNTSGWPSNPWGKLYVYATKGLTIVTGGYPVTPPSVTKQLIDQSYYGPPQAAVSPSTGTSDWEFVSATFTAGDDYNCLWLFPLNPMGPPPPGPSQWNLEYRIEVDDIRVEDITSTPPVFSIPPSTPINGCGGSVSLTIANMSPSYKAVWTPSMSGITYIQPNGRVVTAKPCSTTTYKIEIIDTAASCGNCRKEVIYHTVNVNQWSDSARIIYPPTVPCTMLIPLSYNDPGTCSGVTYTWIDPTGAAHTGNPAPSIVASASMTGEWTLQINMPGKGCAEEHKFNITVGSCCVSNPNFTFTNGTNPVTFTNTGTGITNHVGTLWNFGDGTVSSQANPIHSYTDTVPVTVCLTTLYEDGQGESCCNRICKVVKPGVSSNACVASANFDYNSYPGGGYTSNFTDGSTGNGTICNYKWDFGDGSPVINTTLPTISHSYPGRGPWYVCLTVTNCVYNKSGALVNTCTDTKCYSVNPVPMLGKPDLSAPLFGTEPQPATQPVITTIEQPANKNVLTVYPNPNPGSFILSLLKHTGTYQVVIRDQQGREVYNQKQEFINGSVKIALSEVSNGIYSVEVVNDNERYVQQIAIAK